MNYVVAVSGGVDSIVLLDALASGRLLELTDTHLKISKSQIIVAHFDHGIRSDSREDEGYVRGVAEKLGLAYESERVDLGQGVSEEIARKARYNFLRRCCKKYNARLITAHHKDDVIETMIINLIRGTGWRGLTSLVSNNEILRPLIGVTKSDVLKYAKGHDLDWREDSTNSDTKYLRNYIRKEILPHLKTSNLDGAQRLLEIQQATLSLKQEIATELQSVKDQHFSRNPEGEGFTIPRHFLVMSPSLVSLEIASTAIRELDTSWHPDKKSLQRVLHFIKTADTSKIYQLSSRIEITVTKGRVQFKKIR